VKKHHAKITHGSLWMARSREGECSLPGGLVELGEDPVMAAERYAVECFTGKTRNWI
tara:strand:+ start:1032 stop:1202 length:171 start_codon:yes stop_codon:yes gene_type:complete